GETTFAVKFGEGIFAEAQFGTGTGWGTRAKDSPPLTLAPMARKQIGKRIIYRIRYGKQEQYKYFKPDNPQTEDQQANRGKFATAVAAWQALEEAEKNAWRKEALGSTIPGYQFFLRKEMEK
ncbi:unnamed protein product, partial [marine sediment metagenome]